MKFITAITALATVLAVDAATVTVEKRYTSIGCGPASKSMAAYNRPFVLPLNQACQQALGTTKEARENPWVNKVCVAAAIAADMPDFSSGLECGVNSTTFPILTEPHTWPSLDYNVYASIVGDCAWAPGGCPITQQNFIDLVYSAISETTGGPYPGSADLLVQYYLKPIFEWTAFDASAGIPYTNFNDWLHWSPGHEQCYPFQCNP